jgi:hypothetical protein
MPDSRGGASTSATALHWRWNPTPLGLFLLLMFVLPVFPTFPRHAIGIIAGDGKYFAAGLLAVLGAGWVLPRIPSNTLKLVTTLLFLYYLLLSFALLIDLDRVIARDALELYKPLVAAGSFLFAFGVCYRRSQAVHATWSGLTLLLIFVCALGMIEVVMPGGIDGIVDVYKRDNAVLFRRPITFFHTTYFAASVYLLLGSLFTARAIMSRRLFPNVLMAGAAFVLVILTQSRAAVLALMIVLIWTGILLCAISISDNWATLRRFVAVAVITAALATYGALYAIENLPYLTTGLQRYVLNWDQNLTGGGSLAARAGQIAWALEHNQVILLGAGIGKGYNPLLESWYALYYYRYGLVGIFLYLSVWGGFWVHSLTRLRQVRCSMDRDAVSLVVGLNIFLVGLPVVSFSSVITDQVFLIPIYYGLLGVGSAIIASAKEPGVGARCSDVPA